MLHVTERTRLDLILAADNLLHRGHRRRHCVRLARHANRLRSDPARGSVVPGRAPRRARRQPSSGRGAELAAAPRVSGSSSEGVSGGGLPALASGSRTGGNGLARGWAISGISDEMREAVVAAADAAGMPVGAWVAQALHQALEVKREPAQPEGVEIDELEAMVRRVVVEELAPVREALARPGMTAAPSGPADGSPVSLMRERRRQRRAG